MANVMHNHHRTDGGPEPTGAEHDAWYPDCPMTDHNDPSSDAADNTPSGH